MRLVFMGSGAFALPSLSALLNTEHELQALITQPDKRAGRGHGLRPPPTKELAEEHGLRVHQPKKVREPDGIALVETLAPECIVVVAYGQIIPQAILDIPPKGIINVHGSILPAYRGAAPIQWAIAHGETETGVTTMQMDAGLDTGPILMTERLAIEPSDTAGSLSPKLAKLGASLLVRTLDKWAQDAIEPSPQDDALATLAPRIKKEDGRIDWSLDAEEIHNRVRAFDPWPVAFTELEGKPLKIWRTRVVAKREGVTPGAIASVRDDGLEVACGSGTSLLVEEVQLSGKARMSATAFARGRRLDRGVKLG